ncbi:MAG: GntR family transcriptional regulator [Acetatifactor sp.]
MHMIINNSSMVPIYEQIVNQLKAAIIQGKLAADTMLPSVRGLSGELKISALTVKKAYDCLEEEGYVVTVHGKGTFVSQINPELLKETRQKEVEDELAAVITKAYGCGMDEGEIRELFEIVMEEHHD